VLEIDKKFSLLAHFSYEELANPDNTYEAPHAGEGRIQEKRTL
jgi:hypothetical protein